MSLLHSVRHLAVLRYLLLIDGLNELVLLMVLLNFFIITFN